MNNTLKDMEIFVRQSISEEQETVAKYLDRKRMSEQLAQQCREEGNEELAKKFDVLAYTLEDIKKEEEVHIGQFREMLDLFDISDESEDEGEDEAKEDTEQIIGESFIAISKQLSSLI